MFIKNGQQRYQYTSTTAKQGLENDFLQFG